MLAGANDAVRMTGSPSQAAAVIVTLPRGSVSGRRGLQLRQPLEAVPGCQLHLLETSRCGPSP